MNRAERRRQKKSAQKAGPIQLSPRQLATLQNLLNKAVEYHKAGHLEAAKNLYQQALQIDPKQAMALHFLGLIALQAGQPNVGIDLIQKAIMAQPEYGDAHVNLGNALQEINEIKDAVHHYKLAVKYSPNNIEAHHNLGLALHKLAQFDQALCCFTQAIERSPHDPEIHRNKALSHQSLGQIQKAEDCLKQAIALNPDYALAHLNLGLVYKNTQRPIKAEQSYRKAIAIDPDDAAAPSNLGNLLGDIHRTDEAEQSYRKAILIDPDYTVAYANLGHLLIGTGRLEEAEEICRKAIDIDPTSATAFNNLALSLHKQLRMTEALEYFEQALEINPGHIEAYTNLSAAQQDLGLLDKAEQSLQSALSLAGEHTLARSNLAILQLLKGDFKNGFANYTFRLTTPNGSKKSTLTPPKWKGEDLNNKCLAILAEQGVGDEILYSTFIPELLDKGARLLIECDERLLPVYKRSFPDLTFVAKRAPQNKILFEDAVDYQIEFGSLCQYLRLYFKDFPKPVAFLKANTHHCDRLKERYKKWAKGRPVIGISWRGGNNDTNFKKSINLEKWLPILSNPDYAFLSLQYGDVEKELDYIKQQTGLEILHDPEIDPLQDMDGFTNQVEAVDMVISTSNATVHVAGGLGKKTWLMLSLVPPLWYWHLEREDSLWYPSLRLFRQPEFNDWESVIETIAHELRDVDLL